MEPIPPRSASRASGSGFRPAPPPTFWGRVLAELTRKRLMLVGVTLMIGAVTAFFLDTHFLESVEANGAIEAKKGADARLMDMVRACGGPDRWAQVGTVDARLTDRWYGPFRALSVWGKSDVAASVTLREIGNHHSAKMLFADGIRWGYDGTTAWIEGAVDTPPERLKVERLSVALTQLLLMPFSAVNSGAHAELLDRDTISIRFKHQGTGVRTDEWRLYVDPVTSRLSAVVLPLTASDPSPLTRCEVLGWTTVDGLSLPSGYRCALANRLEIDLHTIEVSEIGFAPDVEGTFSPHAHRPPPAEGKPVGGS